MALKFEDHELAAAYFKLAEKDGWLSGPEWCMDWGNAEVATDYLSDTPKATLSQKHPMLDIKIDKTFTLGQTPHDSFLCIPPTVIWIILRAQFLRGKIELSTEDVVRQLLNLACMPELVLQNLNQLILDPPSKTEESSKKRKIQDWSVGQKDKE